MADILRTIIQQNRSGKAVAIPSVCSAQPDVLRASMRMAERLDRHVVIEATSNQVNQDGGYTGMTPEDFIAQVHGMADENNVARDRIIFGGDHLGPQAWRGMAPDAAMDKARKMVRAYVKAGFGKIHLDCSQGCKGEAEQLTDPQTAQRSMELAKECLTQSNDLLFVVGTEVPPPGGAHEQEEVTPTAPSAARATLDTHFDCFGDMAAMIGGLVVQPGVEFGPMSVQHMPLDQDPKLIEAIADYDGVCLEAHSTDYQHAAVFPRLAKLGFAFQKVGPALTFAYREALYALDQLRDPKGQLQNAMETLMTAAPQQWNSHYHGDEAALRQMRHIGLADRIRYYWPHPTAQAAVQALRDDSSNPMSDKALQDVFDPAVLDRAEALSGEHAQRLIDAAIEVALDPYFFEDTT